MSWIGWSYFLFSGFMGIHIMIDGAFWTGLAVTLATNLSYVSGGGIALARREKNRHFVSILILGLVFLFASILWIGYVGWSVELFHVRFSGVMWCLLGFIVGVLFDLTGTGRDGDSPPKGASISGSNTLDDPIVIPVSLIPKSHNYVSAQYAFISRIHANIKEEWELKDQYLLSSNGRSVDKMVVHARAIGRDGWDREVEYYFDVTDSLKHTP